MTAAFGTPCTVNEPSPGCPADALCVSVRNADGGAHHLIVPAEHVINGILRVNRYGGNRNSPRPPRQGPTRPDGAELVNLYRAALDTQPTSVMTDKWCLHLRPERIAPFLEPTG